MTCPKSKNTSTAASKIKTKAIVKIRYGAVAQLGERYNGIVEVVGSIPSGSTITYKGLAGVS